MATVFTAVRKEDFSDQQGATLFRAHESRHMQLLTAPWEADSARASAVAELKTKVSAPSSNDLDSAKGMIFGALFGVVIWGLLGSLVYALAF